VLRRPTLTRASTPPTGRPVWHDGTPNPDPVLQSNAHKARCRTGAIRGTATPPAFAELPALDWLFPHASDGFRASVQNARYRTVQARRFGDAFRGVRSSDSGLRFLDATAIAADRQVAGVTDATGRRLGDAGRRSRTTQRAFGIELETLGPFKCGGQTMLAGPDSSRWVLLISVAAPEPTTALRPR